MERYTYMDGGKWRLRVGDTEYAGPWVDRLAAYEDICFDADGKERITVEELSALVKARDEGRVVVLPKESIAARFEVADMLEDDLKESSFSDPSVGVYGLTWAQSELWQAIIDGLNAGDAEAEAALSCRECRESGAAKVCEDKRTGYVCPNKAEPQKGGAQ